MVARNDSAWFTAIQDGRSIFHEPDGGMIPAIPMSVMCVRVIFSLP